MKLTHPIGFSVIALAMVLSPGFSQPQATTTARVVVTRLKPEMTNEWVDLEKNEVIPALKKAGVTARTVYQATVFGNSYEYVTVTPFAKYAEFDSPNPLVKALGEAGAARLNQKLRRCVENTTSYSNTRLVDLSNILSTGDPIIVVAHYRIAAGKMADFEALVKSDVLPVYKKGNISLTVNRRGLGANTNEVTMVTGYQKFAQIDGGPFLTQKLGADGVAKLNAKFVGIRNMIDVVVRRRVSDLSF